jgi:hypothetical protein
MVTVMRTCRPVSLPKEVGLGICAGMVADPDERLLKRRNRW